MTSNQINNRKQEEDVRSNKERERENRQHNRTREGLERQRNVAEFIRTGSGVAKDIGSGFGGIGKFISSINDPS